MSRTIAAALVLALLLFAVLPPLAARAEVAKHSILVLNSYHDGYSWSDNIMRGLRQEIVAQGMSADLFIEYLDAKRYGRDTHGRLSSLLAEKYKDQRFDLVISSDNFAFNFAIDHRQELSPDTPLVFCGVNDFDPGRIEGIPATGVLENSDVTATLRIAHKLHPGASKVLVIGDDSVTGRAIRAGVEKAETALSPVLSFEYIEAPLNQVLDRVRNTDSSYIIYCIPYFSRQDTPNGSLFYSPEEIVQMTSEASNRPVYSPWAFLLGHGIVGGKLIAGQDQGRLAAQVAARVLAGEAPASIPLIERTDDLYRFDYKQLKRWGANEDLLPKGSIIVNAPKAFYEISKELFWTGFVVFVVLSSMSVLLIVNILRRRRIEERLKGQLSFLEILMDTIPQLVCWKDANQKYLGANRSFTDFFGIADPSRIIHMTDEEFMNTGLFVNWARETDRKVLETRSPQLRQRVSLPDPRRPEPERDDSGEIVWLEVNKVPLYNAQGKAVGTLSTADNVTREINLERQLLQSQKMEAIGALAGGVAHDFNNILTSIVNSTELALMDVDEESEAGRDLQRVLKAAQRGKRLIEQIMTFSRPSQEGFRPTNLAELVRETVGLLTPSLPRNIAVTSFVDPEVEAAGLMLVDPTQIHQVLMNLCTNSFQAMRQTGGHLAVSLAWVDLPEDEIAALNMRPGPCLRLTVADTGPGIDPDIADKIFDPFFTTKGKHEGTGLGLSVVLGVVKNHGGAVRLHGKAGDGVAFEVFLPASLASEPEAVPGPGELRASGARLLFVEDDQDQLATTPRVLEGLGYKVVPAEGGDAALRVLQSDEFDLVITDFDMPGKSGVQLAREIAFRWPNLPVLLISGRAQAVQEAEGVDNVVRVVAKPFTRHEMAVAIGQALALRQSGMTGTLDTPGAGDNPRQSEES